jgi:hypothetical protein
MRKSQFLRTFAVVRRGIRDSVGLRRKLTFLRIYAKGLCSGPPTQLCTSVFGAPAANTGAAHHVVRNHRSVTPRRSWRSVVPLATVIRQVGPHSLAKLLRWACHYALKRDAATCVGVKRRRELAAREGGFCALACQLQTICFPPARCISGKFGKSSSLHSPPLKPTSLSWPRSSGFKTWPPLVRDSLLVVAG